jgi:hypothetical protein
MKRKSVTLASLAQQPFIMFAPKQSGLHDVITAACRNASFSLTLYMKWITRSPP